MVGSDNEAEDSNTNYGVDYPQSSEGFFFGCGIGDDVGDGSEAREDEDINFRVAEESE